MISLLVCPNLGEVGRPQTRNYMRWMKNWFLVLRIVHVPWSLSKSSLTLNPTQKPTPFVHQQVPKKTFECKQDEEHVPESTVNSPMTVTRSVCKPALGELSRPTPSGKPSFPTLDLTVLGSSDDPSTPQTPPTVAAPLPSVRGRVGSSRRLRCG